MSAFYNANGHWMPSYPGQTCQHCGGAFTAHSKGQKYCGNECKGLARRRRSTRPCENCGKPFEAVAKRVVCSKECQYEVLGKRTLKKRRRVCVVCNEPFIVPSSDRVGRTCSKACQLKHMARLSTGRKRSPEALAKLSSSLKAYRRNNAERSAAQNAAAAEGMARWHSDPENAEAFARRSSERMKRRHADPEWQKVRDERSSQTMRANWDRYRDEYVAAAVERIARMQERGEGLFSEEASRKRAERSKWVMKKAQEALRLETDYVALFTEVQARLRREMPYDGPAKESDYLDYCQRLGRAVVNSPECRSLADSFMSTALPRFSAEWDARQAQLEEAGQ